MNKLMKFCGKCEEGFADRFSFCPNCGGELQTFEMSPINAANAAETTHESAAAEIAAPEAPAILAAETNQDVLEIPEFETVESSANGLNGAENARVYSLAPEEEAAADEAPEIAEPVQPAPVTAAATTAAAAAGVSKGGWREVKSLVPEDDGLYHLTMVPNKTLFNDPRLRAAGVFGLLLVTVVCIGAIVYDLFQQNVFVSAPDSSDLVLATIPITDDIAEIEKVEVPKDKKDGGGGGGGGRKDPIPASEGRMAPQFKEPPLLTPSKEDISVSDPLLKVYRGTQGNRDIIPPNDGRPMGAGVGKIPSDGSGGPLGQGSGDGTGQGPGRGPGSGGGGGGGDGGGWGPGGGPGSGGGDPPPEMPKGPTVNVNVTYKPRPSYTEEARKNQINGTVRLKVVFTANGTIGSITPVSSLGYGLTEQAIAAARNMRFEPAKRGGVPYTVSKVVEFNFNLY
jgi:TonB family protein